MSRIGRKLLEGLGFKFLALVLGVAAASGVVVLILLWTIGYPS